MNLKNNKHLKEVESILDNWEVGKAYLVTNDLHGVDLVAEIDLEELGLGIEDRDKVAELLELHYDCSDYYFRYDPSAYTPLALVCSSSDDIFITYEDELCFPNRKSITLTAENKELEIIAYIEQWIQEEGIYSSIYTLDYYSNSPTSYHYHDSEEYKSLLFSDNEKKKEKEVDFLVEMLEFKKDLDENIRTLDYLPGELYNNLPQILQESDAYIEIISANIKDAHTLEIEFEIEDDEEDNLHKIVLDLLERGTIQQGDNDLSFRIKLSRLPNSIRFLKEWDDKIELITEEVA